MYDLMCMYSLTNYYLKSLRIYKDLNFSVLTRTWKKRDGKKQL